MNCICCNHTLNKVASGTKWNYFKCNNCGFWTTKTLSGEIPLHDYDNSPTYDVNVDGKWDIFVSEAKRILTHKFALAKHANKGVFLDIGCSEGAYVKAAEELGWDSYGFEVDDPKVKRAKEKNIRITPLKNGLLSEASVDFVLIRHVIEHIPNFLDTLKLASALLKPGGTLCVETPNQDGLKSLFVRRKLHGDRFLGHLYPPTHINAFVRKTYATLQDKIGMKLAQSATYSPADPNWNFTSIFHESKLKSLAHKVSVMIGRGESIAVFYKK